MSKDQPVDELDKLFDATINFKQASIDFAAEAELFGDNDSVLATANVKLEEYRKVFKAEIVKLIQAECNRARLAEWERVLTAKITHSGSPAPFNPEGWPISTPATQEMTKLLHEYAQSRIAELQQIRKKEDV